MMDYDTTGIEPGFSSSSSRSSSVVGALGPVDNTIVLGTVGLVRRRRRSRRDRRVHLRARSRGRRARHAAQSTTRSSIARPVSRARSADGPRPHDARRCSRSCPPICQDGQTCRVGHGRRRSRMSTCRAGTSASRRSLVYRDDSARSDSRCPTPGQGRDSGRAGEDAVSSSSTARCAKRLPKSRPSRTTSFTVGGAEGYMTAGS